MERYEVKIRRHFHPLIDGLSRSHLHFNSPTQISYLDPCTIFKSFNEGGGGSTVTRQTTNRSFFN